ncbi:hypothetical protein P154DRAFT_581215 [Amniculicola lignicola CBS 123094]|uniref:Uncharacterized protein n=1 Tax=Amniculicola lignicola CBS 123094 TaxID=1392246 RepID=A0A6A5W2C6_9PLEO|nr:hypothetical protein P154DRAFT_581215 [Amniculicola lignicola CBS 123094]
MKSYLDMRSESIREQLLDSREQGKRFREENDRLRKQLAEAHEKVKLAEAKFMGFQETVEMLRLELQTEVKGLEDELKKSRKVQDALSFELQEERKFIKLLQEERKIKPAVGAERPEEVSTDLSDDEIRRDLDAVFEECRLWAGENYVPVLGDIPEVKKRLIEVGVLAPEDTVAKQYYFNFDADIVADILLEAVLCHELCRAFLENPYFTANLALWVEEESMNLDVPIALKKVTDYLQTKDEERAITWRSDSLKLLTDVSQHQEDTCTDLYCHMAKDLVTRWGFLIHQPLLGKEKELLIKIISKFVDLTSKLWCLKTDIQYHGLGHLEDNTRFSVGSKDLVAARILQLEDGDTRLDGRPIPLVLRPKIDASPRLGSGGKERVVWAKGVVWVSNRANPKAAVKGAGKGSSKAKTLMDARLKIGLKAGGTADSGAVTTSVLSQCFKERSRRSGY